MAELTPTLSTGDRKEEIRDKYIKRFRSFDNKVLLGTMLLGVATIGMSIFRYNSYEKLPVVQTYVAAQQQLSQAQSYQHNLTSPFSSLQQSQTPETQTRFDALSTSLTSHIGSLEQKAKELGNNSDVLNFLAQESTNTNIPRSIFGAYFLFCIGAMFLNNRYSSKNRQLRNRELAVLSNTQ